MNDINHEILEQIKRLNERLNNFETKLGEGGNSRNREPTTYNNFNPRPRNTHHNWGHNGGPRVFVNTTNKAPRYEGNRPRLERGAGRPNNVRSTGDVQYSNLAPSRSHANRAPNPKPNTNLNPTNNATSTQQHWSLNNDFRANVKLCAQILKLSHNQNNWKNLPKSLNRNLDNLFASITPPLNNDNLRGTLKEISDHTKSSLVASVQAHFETTRHELHNQLLVNNLQDLDKAMEIATKQTKTHYGRKTNFEAIKLVASAELKDINLKMSANNAQIETGGHQTDSAPSPIQRIVGINTPQTGPTSAVGENDEGGVTEGGATNMGAETDSDGPIAHIATETGMEGGATATAGLNYDDGISQTEAETDMEAGNGSEGDAEYGGWFKATGRKRKFNKALKAINALNDGENSDPDDQTNINKRINKQCSPALSEAPTAEDQPDSDTDITTLSQPTGVIKDPNTILKDKIFPASQPTPTNVLLAGLSKVHDSTNKAKWGISPRPNTKCVVISDSNMRKANNIPNGWEVHVFPGAKLNHAAEIIKKLGPAKGLEKLVISVGINNRDWNSTNITTDVNKVYSTAEKSKISAYFVGVSAPPTLNDKQKSAINDLNKQALKRFGNRNYISPTDKVSVDPSDSFGIHYDIGTVNGIFTNIKKHFLSVSKGGSVTTPRQSL